MPSFRERRQRRLASIKPDLENVLRPILQPNEELVASAYVVVPGAAADPVNAHSLATFGARRSTFAGSFPLISRRHALGLTDRRLALVRPRSRPKDGCPVKLLWEAPRERIRAVSLSEAKGVRSFTRMLVAFDDASRINLFITSGDVGPFGIAPDAPPS